jgi:hypothetical protein
LKKKKANATVGFYRLSIDHARIDECNDIMLLRSHIETNRDDAVKLFDSESVLQLA